jgi:hypothetical protein
MREKGFLDAEITVDTRPTYGDRRLTLEFTITEGKTIPPSNLGCRTEVACRTVLEMILKDTSTKSGARVYVQAGFDVWRLVERRRLEPDGDEVPLARRCDDHDQHDRHEEDGKRGIETVVEDQARRGRVGRSRPWRRSPKPTVRSRLRSRKGSGWTISSSPCRQSYG